MVMRYIVKLSSVIVMLCLLSSCYRAIPSPGSIQMNDESGNPNVIEPSYTPTFYGAD